MQVRSLTTLIWFFLALFVCTVFVVAAFSVIDKDHAFGIVTNSRALYSDEGWYVKAARNLNVFGKVMLEYDFQHWPAAPIYSAVQSGMFWMFGVGMETARGWSVFATTGAFLAFYLACQKHLKTESAFAALVLVSTTFLIFHFSRSALADPTATLFSLLAVLAYLRFPVSKVSIAACLSLAAIAAMTKSYYVIVFFVIVLNLISLLLVIPWFKRERPNWTLLGFIGVFIAFLGALYAVYFLVWYDSITLWTQVTLSSQVAEAGSITVTDALPRALELFKRMIKMLQLQVGIELMVMAAAAGALAFLARTIVERFRTTPTGFSFSRADWLFMSWTAIGFLLMGSLQVLRSHYLFFLIFPAAYLAVAFWERVLPRWLALALISAIVMAHAFGQSKEVLAWLDRDPGNLMDTAYSEIAEIVVGTSPEEVPLFGMLSSSIALEDPRIIPLEPIWTPPDYSVCDRVAAWEPMHYVLLSGNRTTTIGLDALTDCPIVGALVEIGRWDVFPPWNDVIILYQLELLTE